MTYRLANPTPIILAQQAWQAGAGLVTVVLIALYLTPAQQGWYYTLTSLVALSTLLEFGVLAVLGQKAARLFLALSWDQGTPTGIAASAFVGLAGGSVRYFARLGLLFVLLFLPGGFVFLTFSAHEPIAWQAVFVCLTLATGLAFLPQPLLAMIEGSGQIAQVYGIRLAQGVMGSFLLWTLLVSGAGLWAVLAPALAAGLVPAITLFAQMRPFLRMLRKAQGQAPPWSTEIWPLQWRVGLSQLAAYLTTQIATPILFAAQGADAAGHMGLSLTLCTMLGLMARAHFTGHVPTMAQAAARQDWILLDRLLREDLLWFALAYGGGALLFILGRPVLESTFLGGRLFPLSLLLALLLTVFISAVHTMLAIQLRSFGEEPLLVVTITGAFLTVAAMLWSAPRWGSNGVVFAMALIQLFFVLPASVWVWRRFHGLRRDANPPSDNRHSHL